MAEWLLWIKTIHVLAVISWMAALLYLPRLMVYHAMAEVGSHHSEQLKIMERKLLKAIGTPAMIATWIFGIWVTVLLDVWGETWFLIKFAFVIAITAMHMVYAKHVRLFANDQNTKPHTYFRIINEVPAVFLIGVVIMVIVKPF